MFLSSPVIVYSLACIILAGVVIMLFLGLFMYFTDFFKELHYLNMEIARASHRERRYWIRRRRKLWLSLIPFVKY